MKTIRVYPGTVKYKKPDGWIYSFQIEIDNKYTIIESQNYYGCASAAKRAMREQITIKRRQLEALVNCD